MLVDTNSQSQDIDATPIQPVVLRIQSVKFDMAALEWKVALQIDTTNAQSPLYLRSLFIPRHSQRTIFCSYYCRMRYCSIPAPLNVLYIACGDIVSLFLYPQYLASPLPLTCTYRVHVCQSAPHRRRLYFVTSNCGETYMTSTCCDTQQCESLCLHDNSLLQHATMCDTQQCESLCLHDIGLLRHATM